jgi:hypothetical protein
MGIPRMIIEDIRATVTEEEEEERANRSSWLF